MEMRGSVAKGLLVFWMAGFPQGGWGEENSSLPSLLPRPLKPIGILTQRFSMGKIKM